MRVAVVDIGSNTVRLLVAERSAAGPKPVRQEKAYLGLGAEILRHGSIGDAKLAEVSDVARRYVRAARKLGAERLDVLVTAPGRQAKNADELLHGIAQAARTAVRVLSAGEEAALAFAGAVAAEPQAPDVVAVVDVGGGSTELAIGPSRGLPSWSRSVDLGSLRLTEAVIASDPPTEEEVDAARGHVETAFAAMVPPRAEGALAVGGSARALARIVGRSLGEPELEAALGIVGSRRSAKLARTFDLDPERARLLTAGALILGRVAALLGIPLHLARAGLREGAAALLLAEEAAA